MKDHKGEEMTYWGGNPDAKEVPDFEALVKEFDNDSNETMAEFLRRFWKGSIEPPQSKHKVELSNYAYQMDLAKRERNTAESKLQQVEAENERLKGILKHIEALNEMALNNDATGHTAIKGVFLKNDIGSDSDLEKQFEAQNPYPAWINSDIYPDGKVHTREYVKWLEEQLALWKTSF